MEKVEDLAVSVHKWDLVVRKNSAVIARTQDFGLPIVVGGQTLTLLSALFVFGHVPSLTRADCFCPLQTHCSDALAC